MFDKKSESLPLSPVPDSGSKSGFPIEAFEDPLANCRYSWAPLMTPGVNQEK